jgi:uncharacterized protein YkwD
VKHILFLFLFITYFKGYSQGSIRMIDKTVDYNLPEDTALKRVLNQSSDYKRLSVNDQQVAYYLNYARKNPKIFLDKAINVFVSEHPEIKSSYIGTLQSTFKTLQPLGVILPDYTISQIAMSHADDLRIHKTISHTSTNGKSFQDRLSGVLKGCGSESIHASMRYNPLESVLSLLFDFNVPDLGHRKALLDRRFTKAGFGSSVTHNNYSVLVMDFSCQ